MKYNILIHAINGIGLGHINRLVLIAKKLIKLENIGEIIFVTNSINPFLIENAGFKFFKLDYGIEDTLKTLDFSEYEKSSYNIINEIITNNNINIVIHDTFFIKSILERRRDIKHFLVLRDSEISYLSSIQKSLPKFKKVYIPHIKEEFSDEKLNFYNDYKNIIFTEYITNNDIKKYIKKNKIIISPGYGGDYDNTFYFFYYVNSLLEKNLLKLKNYEVIFILGKNYKNIKNNINFNNKFKTVDFIENLPDELSDTDFFIGRGAYNTVNEVIQNNCKSILFNVERFAENQESRIDFFINHFSLENFTKGTYDLENDSLLLEKLLNLKFIENKLNIFNGLENFLLDFENEINKKNILIFKHIFLPISENFIYEELSLLKNFNPIILTLENQNNFLNNFEIVYFNKFRELLTYDYPIIINKVLYLELLKFLIFFIKKNNIKVIYTEFLFDAYFIVKIKQLIPDIKIISAGRGYDVYSFLKNSYLNTGEFLSKIDKILVRDKIMYEEIKKYAINDNKIDIVRSVLDFSKYNFKEKDFSKLNILIGGRFTDKKGILEVIDLINLLKNYNFIGEIGLIGDGELKENILEKIDKLGLKNKINYYGFLEHKDFLIKLEKYNCFINYSKIPKSGDNEGVNNFITENILSGNIVFSTVVGGIGEIIIDNETGIVLTSNPEFDYIKIKTIFKEVNLNKIVNNGRKLVLEKLGTKSSLEKLENIISNHI